MTRSRFKAYRVSHYEKKGDSEESKLWEVSFFTEKCAQVSECSHHINRNVAIAFHKTRAIFSKHFTEVMKTVNGIMDCLEKGVE